MIKDKNAFSRQSETLSQRMGKRLAPASAPDYQILHDQIKDSTDKNRQFFFGYLALMVYVQAIVLSTSDRMLLIPTDGIKLPLLDLTVPVVNFYVGIPLLVIALHFNLLQNLESHHYKLMQWRFAFKDGLVPRSRVHPFLFDFAVLERGSAMAPWVGVASEMLCFYLGPLTLGLLLWRFTDYQDAGITTWHFAAFGLDGYLVWCMARALRQNASISNELFDPDKKVMLLGVARSRIGSCLRILLCGAGMLAVVMEVSLVYLVTLGIDQQNLLTLAYQANERLSGRFFPRIEINPNEILFEPKESELRARALLDGETQWQTWFSAKGLSFDLSNRSLRFASMERAKLPRVIFRGAQLQGANLGFAELSGADFGDARLDKAKMHSARLESANLRSAVLREASLPNANLVGADLKDIQAQGANFFSAILTVADLRDAHVEGADFTEGQLQVADLRGTFLAGARLSGTDLRAALLSAGDNDRLTGVWFDQKTQVAGVAGGYLKSAVFNRPSKERFLSFDKNSLNAIAQKLPTAAQSKFLKRVADAEKNVGETQASPGSHSTHTAENDVETEIVQKWTDQYCPVYFALLTDQHISENVWIVASLLWGRGRQPQMLPAPTQYTASIDIPADTSRIASSSNGFEKALRENVNCVRIARVFDGQSKRFFSNSYSRM